MGKWNRAWGPIVVLGDFFDAFNNEFLLVGFPTSRVKQPACVASTAGNGGMIWTDEPSNNSVLSVIMHPYT
jgi:hypothetical protein